MKCPMCEKETRPAELDKCQELVIYDCNECYTSWHVHLGELDEYSRPSLVVNSENTLMWLVTCESHDGVEQVQRPGWRQALRQIAAMLEETWDTPPAHPYECHEFSMSADHEHIEASSLDKRSVFVTMKVLR